MLVIGMFGGYGAPTTALQDVALQISDHLLLFGAPCKPFSRPGDPDTDLHK